MQIYGMITNIFCYIFECNSVRTDFGDLPRVITFSGDVQQGSKLLDTISLHQRKYLCNKYKHISGDPLLFELFFFFCFLI